MDRVDQDKLLKFFVLFVCIVVLCYTPPNKAITNIIDDLLLTDHHFAAEEFNKIFKYSLYFSLKLCSLVITLFVTIVLEVDL